MGSDTDFDGGIMKKILQLLATLLLLATLGGVATAEESRTLTGQFVWNQMGKTGNLKAVFTPIEKGKWDVSFHFKFRGGSHTYSGTAEGSLSSGDLHGTVKNESKRRTFTFTGTIQDGRFSGTHAEVEDGRRQSTGTLTLAS